MNLKNFSFAAKIKSNEDIRKIVSIINEYDGILTRMHYDSKIDSSIIFFEIKNSSPQIEKELKKKNFLLTSIEEPVFIKVKLHLPERSRAVSEFLTRAGDAGAVITSIEYKSEEQGNKNILIFTMNSSQRQKVKTFLDHFKSLYIMEIMEYTPAHDELDNTVFYITYTNRIRKFTHDQGDIFILSFLEDIDRIACDLKKLGHNPEKIFTKIYENGETLANSTGENFYADYQKIKIKDDTSLFCFQPPCGGNIYIIDAPEETIMIDTGYGIYHDDIMKMCFNLGLWEKNKNKKLFISHGDADHCGGAGYLNIIPYCHPETIDLIQKGNRAYKSVNENSDLEKIYTRMIGTFSKWRPPFRYLPFEKAEKEKIGNFPVFGKLDACGLSFYVLESHGGHQYGQLFLLEPDAGLFFTVDSVLNLGSISPERTQYNQIADFLMTSVNVDSDLAKKEREDLMAIAEGYTKRSSVPFYICCGHGAVSLIKKSSLDALQDIKRYKHAD